MEKVNHITHKKSKVASKAPNAGDIFDGEIAVNYAKDTERMYIKNASDEIIPFSSDHIIKDYVDKSNSVIIDGIINTVLMDRTMGKGYDVDNTTLANVYGSKEALNMVLKHYKMGLFKDGALVKECAPCRITKAVDGSNININGSEGDIMLYTDVPIYRDRCRVSGVTVPNSSATTHNMIGLGLMPHQIGWKDAKKMNPFAFTPGYVQLDGNEYRSCYNTAYKGSGDKGGTPQAMYKTNFIGASGAQGGYPVMHQSSVDSMQRSRNKGPKYQGIFYEFYEMWLIAMYLELGSLLFTETDSFGAGCTYNTPNASNWISGGSSGIRIKGEGGEGVDGYSALMESNYRIGAAVHGDDGKICPIMGLVGINYYNFEEALESQRFVDALVKSNLTDKVDGVTVLEYDKNGGIKVSADVDLASGSGMKVDKKYYIIRNVPNCQGIGDGVMTYVLNVFVKTSFNANVYHGSVNVGGKTVIFKFSYPTYRGLELFSGAFTQIEGIHHIIGNYGGVRKGSIWYAKDYTDIKYDPTNFTADTDYSVSTSTPDENIPYIKGFVKAGEYAASDTGWVKNTNYDVSLYCATECDDKIASATSYECGYLWRYGSSYGGVNTTDGYPNDGYKNVNASVVGCDANYVVLGRTLIADGAVRLDSGGYAGGFALGNPSL